jgi:hypothetical protein
MANRYIKTPHPAKDELERLYHQDFKTQSEIAAVYNTTQRVVFRWFRDLGIQSRIPYKRNQHGENNSSWKGSNATYAAYHYRVQSKRGKATKCEECGRSDAGISYDWANMTGRYDDISDYKELCRSCHFKKDGHKNNFPNRREVKLVNKRKLIDGK